MVLSIGMKLIFRILFIVILIFTFSCEEKGWLVYCPDCNENEPLTTNLEIRLSGELGSDIEVFIYEGCIEDSVLLEHYNYAKPSTYSLPVNKEYSGMAKYTIGATYIAIDSATPRVKYEKEQCDNPCYYVYDKILDLRLRYYEKE